MGLEGRGATSVRGAGILRSVVSQEISLASRNIMSPRPSSLELSLFLGTI